MTVKTTTLILLALLTSFGLQAQTPPVRRPVPQPHGIAPANPAQNRSAALPTIPALPASTPSATPPKPATASQPSTSKSQQMIPAGTINFQGVDVDQVLQVYAQYVGRTLLRAGLPQAKIVLQTETPLTKSEVIEALQGVLALNGIALINVGTKFVKAVPIAQANQEGQAFNTNSATQLPNVGQYVTHIVQLEYTKPSVLAPILQQFAKSPNAVYPIDDNGILILRDYAENVKRMLEFIKQVDVPEQEEFVSDVIPIKYALASDIANALNSLGTGGGTVTIGSSSGLSSGGAPNLRGTSSFGTRYGGTSYGGTPYGGTSYGGTPYGSTMGYNPMSLGDPKPLSAKLNQDNVTYTPMAAGDPAPANTFSQRLRSIINRAAQGGSGNEKIQILGPIKIIADQRSNSLLVFATRHDMKIITNIVAKLDVLLPQVLIQSVILDVNLSHGWNLGVSAAQTPKAYNSTVSGAGGYNNGQQFYDFVTKALGTNAAADFANSLGGGFSYFGNLGQNWKFALQAAASSSDVTIVQRPSIMTFQAKPATFFVGQNVPYVQNNYYGYSGGTSYAYIPVGVGLTVTPFINPSGLVVMQIQQQINDIASAPTSAIQAPTTDNRSITSEVAVRSGDTIMLGGYITTNNTKGRSGVPILEDIPLLGNLFSSRTDNKNRTELIVLMHPVVLNTPEEAATQVSKEMQTLPGVTQAMAQDKLDEQKQMKKVQAELRRERAAAEYEQGGRVTSDELGNGSLDHSSTAAPSSSENGLFQPAPEGSVETNITTYPGH